MGGESPWRPRARLCGAPTKAASRPRGRAAGPYTLRMNTRDEVIIIGGGAIGLASALALVEAGRSVRVLEAKTVGSGSSHGNCGTITPSHAAPLAAPGRIAKTLRWMLTPDAPFYVAPRFDPALWNWMRRFAARCNPRDWRAAMQAKAAILQASRQGLPEWLARHGIDCEFEASG